MCIISPKRRGIEKLPKVGIYYKWLGNAFTPNEFASPHRHFTYVRGWNDIPETVQETNRKDGSSGRLIRAGGHFLMKNPGASTYRIVAAFEIHREDITYVGKTYVCGTGWGEVNTVLAKRAKLLGLARNIKRLRKVKGKKK